jgi:DNA-binding beta-propeller fold protein YncE/mono/diheme cytochrome c family protein
MQLVPHWTNSVALALLAVVSAELNAAESKTRFRQPVSLQFSADERFVFVANARSGSLTAVDWRAGSVIQEKDIGKRLSALRRLASSHALLVTDELAHELVLCEVKGSDIQVRQRLPVSQYPVDVVVSQDGNKAFVSSLWSHRISAIKLTSDGENHCQLEASEVLDLPFAPRCLLLVRSGTRLIAADAFGGNLAIIDTQQLKLLHVRTFPSHNIRGLGISPDGKMLLVAHQMLNELAHTTNNDVHWGLLMSNDLRWLPLDSILSTTADLYTGAHMHPLGHAGNATGDPSGLAITADGTVIVTLGGIDELAMGQERDFSFQRLGVGKRPTGVTVSHDGQFALVANTFADSVSVVDLKARESVREISLGPQPQRSLADRGELLFYDARLSHDGWMSCHSCHTDGHSNGLLNDNFSDDSFGAPKRVLSLAGQTDTAPFAWNAKAATLDSQIRNSITHTMQGDEPPTDRQVAALIAYIQSLPLPPSLTAARGETPGDAAARGEKLFAALQCARCHVPPTYTSSKVFDVGIHDKQGNKAFNPPSLRSVSQRGPFFHDNRAETLEAVFRDVGHQLDRNLSDDEMRDLVAFLNGL